jgi:hypothetical protein
MQREKDKKFKADEKRKRRLIRKTESLNEPNDDPDNDEQEEDSNEPASESSQPDDA